MRQVFAGILVLICVCMLGSVLVAENQMGIADRYQVNFSQNVRVADTLLPKGEYEIRHEMQGSDKIMVPETGDEEAGGTASEVHAGPVERESDLEREGFHPQRGQRRSSTGTRVQKGDRAKHVF